MAQYVGFTRNKASEILAHYIEEDTYVCVFNAPPNEYGLNSTEPSTANGYRRTRFGELDKSIGGQIANLETIFLFESINNGCGSASYVGLAKTSIVGQGDIFLIAELTAPISMPAGTVPLIRAHAFKIGLDKEVLEEYEE